MGANNARKFFFHLRQPQAIFIDKFLIENGAKFQSHYRAHKPTVIALLWLGLDVRYLRKMKGFRELDEFLCQERTSRSQNMMEVGLPQEIVYLVNAYLV